MSAAQKAEMSQRREIIAPFAEQGRWYRMEINMYATNVSRRLGSNSANTVVKISIVRSSPVAGKNVSYAKTTYKTGFINSAEEVVGYQGSGNPEDEAGKNLHGSMTHKFLELYFGRGV